MWRTVFGVLVVAHGLLTIGIWTPNPRTLPGDAPMDTSHSWLFGDRTDRLAGPRGDRRLRDRNGRCRDPRSPGVVDSAGLLGGVLSLVLFGLFFTPWWAAAIAISAALIVVAIRDGVVA